MGISNFTSKLILRQFKKRAKIPYFLNHNFKLGGYARCYIIYV